MSTRSLLALALLLCLLAATAAFAADDAIPTDIAAQLGLPPGFSPSYVLIATSPDQKLSDEKAAKSAPDILTSEACHVGGNRVLLKTTFARPVSMSGSVFIEYLDLDGDPATGRVDKYHGGTDVQLSFSDDSVGTTFYGAFSTKNTGFRTAIDGNALYVAVDAPFVHKDNMIRIGAHLLSEKEGGAGDSTGSAYVQLPVSTATVPTLPLGKPGITKSLRDFRYYNDRVMYEKLSDKGLKAEQISPRMPDFKAGRPRPEPTFLTQTAAPRPGALAHQQVKVNLLEEAGVKRTNALLSFGFPLPRGGLYDLGKIRLLDGSNEVLAQFTATTLWDDGSLKWVLIDATVPLKANEQRDLSVEFGNNVKHAIPDRTASYVTVKEDASHFLVTAGGLQHTINKDRFNLFSEVRRTMLVGARVVDKDPCATFDPAGVTLLDEQGKRYTMGQPDRLKLEVSGPQKAVIRAEGPYTAEDGSTYQRWICRLTFHAGSPLVEAAITQINDYTKTEFTDLTSLDLGLQIPGGLKNGSIYGEGLKPLPAKSLFQIDDQRLQADASAPAPGKAPGVITWDGGSALVHDFWQRWPKSLTMDDQGLSFGLLPKQPNADFGKDEPYYLMYNLCEGKYRARWGMGFTTKISFDFSGNLKPDELYAEVQKPVVAVVPASWYAQTGALGPVAAPLGKQFALWDKYVTSCFADNERTRQSLREYGYYNYGDWFGERGRNWGNNEYDLPHGLFMEYARTGDRDMFRWACVGAQHRSDTDTCWAYPDPFYVGCNPEHSIGHSGTWTQDVERATWTHRYDGSASAENGHTWADGLMDAWYLTGEPRDVEGALALGEHITWGMSQVFHDLGTHERSAGWSLRAIMAIYNGTYDPAYLEAAKRIVAVPLREQKFDQGGAWPHVLPQDHAGDTPGAVGNNMFLMGVLLGGLQAYHEVTHDPAVLKSLESGSAWVARSFDDMRGGWPYSATVENRPLYTPETGLNQLIITPLAYTGLLTKNDKLLQIADAALTATVLQSAGGNGKGMAQQAFFTSGVLAELQQWYAATRPDKGASVLDGSPAVMAQLLVKTASSDRFSVRAPDQKLFFVRLGQDISQLNVSRTPHGAMNKRAEFATIKVLSDSGQTVAQDKCSTDDAHDFTFPLVGKGAAQFKVVIDDDQRGVWDLKGENLQIVTKTSPDFRIGGVGRTRYYFMVPPGVTEFKLKLVGVHTGSYGAVVLTGTGKVAGTFEGSNPGAALIQGSAGATDPRPNHPELGELTIKPAAADTGKIWSVILSAGGDIGVDLIGVPPYLALSPAAWFEPKE